MGLWGRLRGDLKRASLADKHLQVFASERIEDRFTEIWRLNVWGNDQSVSGSGSTLAATVGLREALPRLFEQFGIRSILDAPCGDFGWMNEVLGAFPRSLDYTGGDIVVPLVAELQARHGREGVRFMPVDLTRTALPRADILICRDCLFHLSYRDTRAALANFVASGIPWLLTTTHRNEGAFGNHDIDTGDFRRIDLFSAPYNLPREVAFRFDDWCAPDPVREMCLWSRDHVRRALEGFDLEASAANRRRPAPAAQTQARVRDLVLAHAPPGRPVQVLDVPSGEGGLASLLAAAGMTVTALDDAPVLPFRFDPALRRIHDRNRGLPFEADAFDVVASVDGIEMLENPTGFLREAARVLRPGGLLVLAARNVDSLRSRRYAFTRGHPRYFGPDTRMAKEFGRRHPVDMMFMQEACVALGLDWVEVAANRVSGKTWWSERLRHRLQRHLPPYMRGVVPFYGEMVIYAVRKPSGTPATPGAAA